MKRTFEYDKNIDKYVLLVENELQLLDGKKTVGHQYQTIKQVWNKDALPVMLEQLKQQKTETETVITNTKKQLEKINLSDREKQKIKVFAENLKKAQNLQTITQYEETLSNHQSALSKINKDIEEIENAIQN